MIIKSFQMVINEFKETPGRKHPGGGGCGPRRLPAPAKGRRRRLPFGRCEHQGFAKIHYVCYVSLCVLCFIRLAMCTMCTIPCTMFHQVGYVSLCVLCFIMFTMFQYVSHRPNTETVWWLYPLNSLRSSHRDERSESGQVQPPNSQVPGRCQFLVNLKSF